MTDITFTDDQRAAVLNYLIFKQEEGFKLEDVIAELELPDEG